MTTQWTGPEDPAETARWEAEKQADQARCEVGSAWRDVEHAARAAQADLKAHRRQASCTLATLDRTLARHTGRTTHLAIACTAFVSGALAALGVLAVAAGWHWLGAR